jgi:hypothetical protein
MDLVVADIQKQLEESSIPFPQRHLLALELKQDLAGVQDTTEATFTKTDLDDLIKIHSTRLHRVLNLLGEFRKPIETTVSFIPLVVAATLFSKEGKVIDFIREGGTGMYVLIVIGAFLLAKEFLHVFRLIVVKDHSKTNLRLDTPSVILGCLALVFFGLGWSILGIYISANASLQAGVSHEILLTGIKESLTPTILSALLSGLVILAHYTTRRVLHIWHAPVLD